MATLHLLHGGVGAGKTTFARQLERELPAVRFTHDEWMVRLYGTNPPADSFPGQVQQIWDLIWDHAERTLRVGADVVLDGGFWTRASRDEARSRAAAVGASCRLYQLVCPTAVARERVLQRTAVLPPGTLEISGPTFDGLNQRIEPLGADEEAIRVDTTRLPPP